ncbi:SURF1 family protein [Streptomyces radicis]|uniref:SURF1-like protein n=1 Tax=Streptomyces radicis TaxID=1750517 RepID=A0A3A9WD25_9ACTN|nr:SURF1 family protein [Streptomyces radicis]RKN10193.1 SURF1 family protein [Streptomyces radicis]RKN24535.1 SURF1 family protein [Streptomyces radicis]
MYRFLLTPRWWAINVFVVLSIPVCLIAGTWQLGRFEDQVDSHREQRELAENTGEARPFDELMPLTTETVGRQAEITGTFDAEHQLLVPGRTIEGDIGFYALTPLHPADGGPAVPVVRGWLPGPADASAVPAPPGGEATVSGALQAAESPSEITAPTTALPEGQLGVISAASLINVLPYPVADVWITVRDAEAPLTPVPAEAPTGTGLDMDAFQNLGYTAEWFVFAAFAVFMWFRLFRREVETQRDAELGLHPGGHDDRAGRGGSGAPEAPPSGLSGPPARAPVPDREGAPARSGSPAPPA